MAPVLVKNRAGRLDVRDHVVVRMHRRLLEVAHEAVHGLGVDNVRGDEEGRHHHLSSDDEEARGKVRLKHVKTHEQVHALVLRLLEEREDPAVIALQGAQALEMAKSGSDKAWNASDALLRSRRGV